MGYSVKNALSCETVPLTVSWKEVKRSGKKEQLVWHSFIRNIQKEGGNDNKKYTKYNNIPQRKVLIIAKR